MAVRKPGEKLTAKEERFVREYLVDGNGRAAAMRAGYSEGRSKQEAQNLLRRKNVTDEIERLKSKVNARVETSAEDTLREIKRLAMFDPADLTDVHSPQDIKNLPEEVRRAIIGWKWDKEGRFMIQFAKPNALDMLAKHHGLYERDNKQKQPVVLQLTPEDGAL